MRPLVVGRGPWAKNIWESLEALNVPYTITGRPTVHECIAEARNRGNTHVIIATPLSTHYNLAYEALVKGLPTFVEKPLGATLAEVQGLKLAWADNGQPRFLVDSVHLFTDKMEAIRAASTCVPASAHAAFGGPGPVRDDCSGVWDYGWHALSCLYAAGVPLGGWGRTHDPNWFARTNHLGHSFVASNEWPEKIGALDVGEGRFTRDGDCDSGCMTYRAYLSTGAPTVMERPLKRALQLFLDPTHDWEDDYRFGFDLPLAVTQVLESVSPLPKK